MANHQPVADDDCREVSIVASELAGRPAAYGQGAGNQGGQEVQSGNARSSGGVRLNVQTHAPRFPHVRGWFVPPGRVGCLSGGVGMFSLRQAHATIQASTCPIIRSARRRADLSRGLTRTCPSQASHRATRGKRPPRRSDPRSSAPVFTKASATLAPPLVSRAAAKVS